MDRRKAMKIAAGMVAGGGAGIFALSIAFKPELQPVEKPGKLEFKKTGGGCGYEPLDPAVSSGLAYEHYVNGSCMYAVFFSVASQLADKFGEPYASFPYHMMKYGHGGIGGFGTTCGAINGAAALVGLLVTDKKARDNMICDLFHWYEKTPLPEFIPHKPAMSFMPPTSVSGSPLCHASNTNWVKATGYKTDSKERKERCRRLSSDVAAKVTTSLNEYFSNTYLTGRHDDQNERACMTCHGTEGKLDNTSGKMSCGSCHTETAAHKIFSGPHYKLMKEK